MGYCERPSLALSSLAGAGAHRTQTWLFARLLCALSCVPALVVCASFVPVASASTRVPALTLGVPTRVGVGAFLVFACGRALLGLTVGVFARGWLGLVFALLPVFACGVCVLWCVRSPGGWDSSVSPPLPLLVGVHAPVWALLACVRAGGRLVRGGTWLSRPL